MKQGTIVHIMTNWSKLTQNEYKKQVHQKKEIHTQETCADNYKFNCVNKYYQQKPEIDQENKKEQPTLVLYYLDRLSPSSREDQPSQL